jgi:hypothetical protein
MINSMGGHIGVVNRGGAVAAARRIDVGVSVGELRSLEIRVVFALPPPFVADFLVASSSPHPYYLFQRYFFLLDEIRYLDKGHD